MKAGAAETIITPPVGLSMTGWSNRIVGDTIARYVHDDVFVKAICLEQENTTLCVAVLDIAGIDQPFVKAVRKAVSESVGIAPDSIMVSATHCHSNASINPIALGYTDENMGTTSSGNVSGNWQSPEVRPAVLGENDINWEWREEILQKTIDTIIAAWRKREEAVLSYAEQEIEGVASSRRVHMKNGNWGDPRDDSFDKENVESISTIDPNIRTLFIKARESGKMIGVLVNYGSHPWLLSISGYSAEISGSVASKVAAAFSEENDKPIVLYTVAPLGDATMIWNLDIKNMWKSYEGESVEDGVKRREAVYDKELDRLGDIMCDGIVKSYQKVIEITSNEKIESKLKKIKLPFKDGYYHLDSIIQSEEQKSVKDAQLTEIQAFRIGEFVILGMPAEPFSSLGFKIREKTNISPLMIIAHANDSGGFQYYATKEEYSLGGYEITISTLKDTAGEIMVDEAVKLLKPSDSV